MCESAVAAISGLTLPPCARGGQKVVERLVRLLFVRLVDHLSRPRLVEALVPVSAALYISSSDVNVLLISDRIMSCTGLDVYQKSAVPICGSKRSPAGEFLLNFTAPVGCVTSIDLRMSCTLGGARCGYWSFRPLFVSWALRCPNRIRNCASDAVVSRPDRVRSLLVDGQHNFLCELRIPSGSSAYIFA
jgi:hypothetical protein